MPEKLETNLVIKWGSIIAVISIIIGYFFTSIMAHESRLSRVETRYEAIDSRLESIVDSMREFKQDLKDHAAQGDKLLKWK